ncbi:MAG: hypothetical protein GEV07_17090 [Streptosporangiales bacterium]|nr:hypothetical protein [Streptosporangiales bacterium]
MSDHFDTDTLADHAEGVLEGARDAHVRAHVEWCTECSGVVDQLRSVQSMLSSLPEPTLPPDVADRIDASLAHAQQERAELSRGDAPTARKRPWFISLFTTRPQLLAGAAALVVVLAFFGGYLATQSGPEKSSDNGQTNQAIPPKQDDPLITGRHYTKARVANQARALVADRQDDDYTPDPQASAQLSGEIERLSEPAELKKCIAALTGGEPSRIVAVDLGEFEQKPAAVVVMSVAGEADKYEVAVVGPGCTAGDAQVIYRTFVAKA